jgi:hypothetical protein
LEVGPAPARTNPASQNNASTNNPATNATPVRKIRSVVLPRQGEKNSQQEQIQPGKTIQHKQPSY